MADILVKLGSWNWLIIGLVLVTLESLLPGVFLFWLGLAALIVGLLSFVVDWTWQIQIITFAVMAMVAVPVWRRIGQGSGKTEETFLNRRTDALVGRVFTLDKPIQDGNGTIRIDDTIWRVSGPDTPAGSHVKVVRVNGVELTVEAA